MSAFLDYDPLRGVREDLDYTTDGRMQIHYSQDVEPLLDLTKYERVNGLADTKAQKDKDIRLFARIPPVIILELKHKYGVDIFKRDHLKRALSLIETEYPHLKTTDMRMFRGGRPS